MCFSLNYSWRFQTKNSIDWYIFLVSSGSKPKVVGFSFSSLPSSSLITRFRLWYQCSSWESIGKSEGNFRKDWVVCQLFFGILKLFCTIWGQNRLRRAGITGIKTKLIEEYWNWCLQPKGANWEQSRSEEYYLQ